MTQGGEPVRLLWADDDSLNSLEPFGRKLERAGFRVIRVVDYVSAIEELNDAGIHSVLLDVILPHELGAGSLAYDLGITLAEQAAVKGIRTIVFLTVVRKDDILEKYEDLTERFTAVRFDYFDKTQLLEKHVFDELKNRLNSKE